MYADHTIIGIFVALLVFALVFYLIKIIPFFEGWIQQAAWAVVAVVFLIWVLRVLLPLAGAGF